MSKVDDVFDFADELIDEWGHYVTFVRKENSVYDPETGSTTETETRQQVKVVISKLDISEYGGLYQQNDVKIILDQSRSTTSTSPTKTISSSHGRMHPTK